MDNVICTIGGCTENAIARDWCRTHYQRWYRHGDPLILGPLAGAGIYRISGPTERFYIGSSDDLHRRWRDHRNRLNAGTHHNRALQADWKAHGETAFTFSVIEVIAERGELISAETRWLAAAPAGVLYNVSVDARNPARGLVHTAEARQKMSVAIRAAMTPENIEGKRRRAQGSQNNAAKLDENVVLAICDRLLDGDHPKQVAADLGVVQETIYQIRSGRIWTHLVPAETVTAMMAVRQNPWAAGIRTVTDEHRERFAGVGRANKGRPASEANKAITSARSRGAGNPKAKVTEDQVREIKALLATGSRNKDVAATYGLHPNTVSKIKSGEIWSHVA